MDFIEKERQRQREEREAGMKEYRGLVAKLGGSRLTPAEEKRLSALIEQLSRNLETVEADTEVFRQQTALQSVADTLPADLSAQREAEKLASAFDAERAAALDGWEKRRMEMRMLCRAALDQVKKSTAAREQLAELQSRHWQLFGDPDPEVEARKTHLCQAIFLGEPKNVPHGVITLEQVMGGPAGHAHLAQPDADERVVAFPGQTPEEAAALLAEARRLITANRPGRYLLTADDADRAKFDVNLVLRVDAPPHLHDIGAYNFGEQRFVYTFIPAPGQTQEQVDALAARLRRTLITAAREAIRADRISIPGGIAVLEKGASK